MIKAASKDEDDLLTAVFTHLESLKSKQLQNKSKES